MIKEGKLVTLTGAVHTVLVQVDNVQEKYITIEGDPVYPITRGFYKIVNSDGPDDIGVWLNQPEVENDD